MVWLPRGKTSSGPDRARLSSLTGNRESGMVAREYSRDWKREQNGGVGVGAVPRSLEEGAEWQGVGSPGVPRSLALQSRWEATRV